MLLSVFAGVVDSGTECPFSKTDYNNSKLCGVVVSLEGRTAARGTLKGGSVRTSVHSTGPGARSSTWVGAIPGTSVWRMDVALPRRTCGC